MMDTENFKKKSKKDKRRHSSKDAIADRVEPITMVESLEKPQSKKEKKNTQETVSITICTENNVDVKQQAESFIETATKKKRKKCKKSSSEHQKIMEKNSEDRNNEASLNDEAQLISIDEEETCTVMQFETYVEYVVTNIRKCKIATKDGTCSFEETKKLNSNKIDKVWTKLQKYKAKMKEERKGQIEYKVEIENPYLPYAFQYQNKTSGDQGACDVERYPGGAVCKKKCKKDKKQKTQSKKKSYFEESLDSSSKSQKIEQHNEKTNNDIKMCKTSKSAKKRKMEKNSCDDEMAENASMESTNKKRKQKESKQDSVQTTLCKMDESKDSSVDNNGQKISQPVLGQWSTAELGTEERQQKFLRLMGGFKKESSSSLSKINGKSFAKNSKPVENPPKITAMNKGEENTLKKNLENQFERAMALKLNQLKGGGLGYEGKKFYIDKTKSKSKIFDD